MEQNTQKPLGQNPARRAAVRAVVRLHRGGWANLTAKSALAGASLSERDRAFAGALFFGVAERLYTLDYLLAPLLSRPLEKLDVEVRAILEAGLYQLRYMRVPPAAAVDESVKLARALGKSSAAGLVNAVLRRAAALPEGLPGPFEDEVQRVCATWSVGRAVARAVMQALPDEYDAFFEASFAKPELCLRINTLRTDAGALRRRLECDGFETREGGLAHCLYARIPGDIAQNTAFREGLFHVQGAASQYVCALLAPQRGQKVLDLCAAPGGKTATLAQLMAGGEGLTACDIRENRLPLIAEMLRRLGIEEVRLLLADATQWQPGLAGAQRVLCDVPCSGLGVLASKPDIRYTEGDRFSALPALQLAILRNAARYVLPGGRLVYSTCTIRPQENADVVGAFLAEAPDFAPAEPSFLPRGALCQNSMVTLLPHRAGMDGFFAAVLERRGEA